MRLAPVALAAACVLSLSAGAASAATIHLLGYQPDPRLHALDTVTGTLTPGPDPAWPADGVDLAVAGGRVWGIRYTGACAGIESPIHSYDYESGVTELPVALSYPGLKSPGGLAGFGSRLFLSFRWGNDGPECHVRRLAEVAPDGSLLDVRLFPAGSSLEKIAFAPDGRLFAIDQVATTVLVYLVDPDALTLTLVGSHALTSNLNDYFDLVFTDDGEMWALERDISTNQRLRRIDPANGAVISEIALPPSSTLQLRGLAILPHAPTPTLPASWGGVKGAYR